MHRSVKRPMAARIAAESAATSRRRTPERASLAIIWLAVSCAAPRPEESPEPLPGPVAAPLVSVYHPRPHSPDTVGDFVQIDRIFDDVSTGTQTRYRAPAGWDLDAFVYPVPWPDVLCPIECTTEWANNEAESFATETREQLLRLGYFASMTMLADSAIEVLGPTTLRGRHLVFKVTDDMNRTGRSDFLGVGYHGYQIKVRLTDMEEASTSEDAVRFLQLFAQAVEPAYECAMGLGPAEAGLGIESVVGVEPTRLASLVDSVMESQGYDVKYAANGIWTSLPQFEWPSSLGAELTAGEPNPGFQTLIALQPRGDSTAYSIYAPTVCALGGEPADEPPSIIRALQLAVTGSLALGLSKRVDSLPRPQ